ncbi:NADPH-dependent FMN reductase [Parasphingorhabdus sp.]|uniref:NADPH-dependent FMN reductase n=1 Tax=Parasphingorhabdus sp. TaxID=2709688 RepID=UPI003A90F17B
MTKIAVIAGSVRSGSFNRMLAKLAIAQLEAHGGTVTEVDLSAFDLPIYSAELEANNFPPDALRLKQILSEQDGLLVVSPEYNGSIPPLLKNAIDWASRPTGEEGLIAFTAYRGKAAAIMAASLSPFGGLRGLTHLRQILNAVEMTVIPEQVVIPAAHTAYESDGRLKEELPTMLVSNATARLIKVARALAE